MSKANINYNCGYLEFNKEKGVFTGYIDGMYAVLQKSKDQENGKWYLNKTLNAFIFDKDQEKNYGKSTENDVSF